MVTQTETATVNVAGARAVAAVCTIEAAVQMPYPLAAVQSPTHPLQVKRTETVATVRWDGVLYVEDHRDAFVAVAVTVDVAPRRWHDAGRRRAGRSNLSSGFVLAVRLTDMHVPRMWIEEDPTNRDHRACMVTFYPDFGPPATPRTHADRGPAIAVTPTRRIR